MYSILKMHVKARILAELMVTLSFRYTVVLAGLLYRNAPREITHLWQVLIGRRWSGPVPSLPMMPAHENEQDSVNVIELEPLKSGRCHNFCIGVKNTKRKEVCL